MSDQILNKNITISSAQDTGTQIKLKDETGKTYSFFKSKKDGNQTQAMAQFAEYKVGERTGISYKQVPFTAKDGTNVMLNNVLGFMPLIQETAEVSPPKAATNNAPQPQNEYQPEVKDERFWDKKAYKQCLWAKWLKDSDQIANTTLNWKDKVWEVFNEIEQDAEKRFLAKDIPF